MNQSDIPFFIRDIESRFMYANKSCLYLLNITSNINVEGKLDEDLPVDWAEFSNDFKKQDRLTEYNGKSTSIITTQRYNFKADLQSYFSPKTPLYSKGECIGTVGFANKLKFISIPDFIDGKNPFVLSSSSPNKIFTDRELDIIFFSMQRLTAKEISRKLDVSHRTIENKLQTIYNKIGINSVGQLIEYCKVNGFDNFIPSKYLDV